MKKKNIVLNFGKFCREIKVNVVPFWYEGIGLMFKGRNYSKNLLFSFGKRTSEPIHSFFVFRKFLAIWCDKNFNILDFKVVSPWRFFVSCRREFDYLIEIPCKNFDIFSRRELDELLEKFK